MIGCACPVCTSPNPKNRRLRSSAVVEIQGRALLLDTSTDLREQALRFGVERVDAVLYTHAHADHIHGIDELRAFNIRHLHEIPCYGNAETLARIRGYFRYIFDGEDHQSMRPYLTLEEIKAPCSLLGIKVVPVPLWHGDLEVLGYRLGDLAYLTDVSRIPDTSWELLTGLEWLVVDALRPRSHPTHFSTEEALAVIERIRPRRALLTHLSHVLEHEGTNGALPPGVELAYDGLTFELADPPPGGNDPIG